MIYVRESLVAQSLEFVDYCFEHSAHINGYDKRSFLKILKPETVIYIVNKGNKDVGFFCQTYRDDGKEISCEFYLHPRACNLALLSIVKVGAIRTYLDGIRRGADSMLLRVRDSLSARNLVRLLPGLRDHRLSDKNFICFGQLESMKDLKFNFKSLNESNLTFEIDV